MPAAELPQRVYGSPSPQGSTPTAVKHKRLIYLYAATPMIEKPIQINFDSDGRLWICGSHIYPQLNVNEEQRKLVARFHSAGHLLDMSMKRLGQF